MSCRICGTGNLSFPPYLSRQVQHILEQARRGFLIPLGEAPESTVFIVTLPWQVGESSCRSHTISEITAVIQGNTIVSRFGLGNLPADFNLLEDNSTPHRCKHASL